MAAAHDKRHDFLWIVQMFMLKNTAVTGWHGFVGDAVAASYRIPDALSARDAAREFWAFCDESFRGDVEAQCPGWMSNLSDPS